VVIVDQVPVTAVLGEAARFGADVIVVGWRGHGPVRRLLMGSVSRGVVRGARCAVMVVRRRRRVRRVLVGLDGSVAASRALALVGRLVPPAGGHVTLLTSVTPMTVPSRRALPGAADLAREIKRRNAERASKAMRELDRAASRLARGGWRTRTMLTTGEPLRDLLGAVASTRADLLVIGARGASGLRQLLLGSVADGALNRSPMPVLIAR
jgi:nucleotide-binding universal stress UspA family protein